jgi:hypothetical protein
MSPYGWFLIGAFAIGLWCVFMEESAPVDGVSQWREGLKAVAGISASIAFLFVVGAIIWAPFWNWV